MNFAGMKRYVPTAAPISIIMLIGLLLLSALLYYKAVRAQRYLEPSLALAQPRVEFTNRVANMFQEQFGLEKISGIVLTGNSIYVDGSLIFKSSRTSESIDAVFLKKLSSIFLAMLSDREMRSHFDLILVNTRVHFSPSVDENRIRRVRGQHIAESVVDSLYAVEPGFSKYYGIFAPTAVPDKPDPRLKWIEFRIIPSERVHVEMMESLNKYYF